MQRALRYISQYYCHKFHRKKFHSVQVCIWKWVIGQTSTFCFHGYFYSPSSQLKSLSLIDKKKPPHFPLTISAGIIPPHRGSGKAECDRYVPVRYSLIHMLTNRAGLDFLVLLFGEFCCYFLDRGDEFWEEAKTTTVFVVSVSMYGLLNIRNIRVQSPE